MSELNVMRLKGLKKVEIKDLSNESSLFVEIGSTTPDSFVITKGDDSVTDEFIEEMEEAVDEITTQKGVREVTWSTKNVHKDVFMAIAGGAYDESTKTWSENANGSAKEVSIRATSENGVVATISRAKIRFSGDLKFTKNSLSQLTIKAKQLAPLDSEAGFSIQYPA